MQSSRDRRATYDTIDAPLRQLEETVGRVIDDPTGIKEAIPTWRSARFPSPTGDPDPFNDSLHAAAAAREALNSDRVTDALDGNSLDDNTSQEDRQELHDVLVEAANLLQIARSALERARREAA